MKWDTALIEWESGGLNDVPTENILDFLHALSTELKSRQKSQPNIQADAIEKMLGNSDILIGDQVGRVDVIDLELDILKYCEELRKGNEP